MFLAGNMLLRRLPEVTGSILAAILINRDGALVGLPRVIPYSLFILEKVFCLWICFFLTIIGITGLITLAGYIPKPVVRGVQLSTGVLLIVQGVRLMLGTYKFQAIRQSAEPYLEIQHVGGLPGI